MRVLLPLRVKVPGENTDFQEGQTKGEAVTTVATWVDVPDDSDIQAATAASLESLQQLSAQERVTNPSNQWTSEPYKKPEAALKTTGLAAPSTSSSRKRPLDHRKPAKVVQ